MQKKILLSLSLCLYGSLALSQDLNFSVVQARGNGCPEGTTSVVTSPDGKTLSILFDALQSSVPNNTGNNDNGSMGRGRMDPNLDYKVCDILIEATLAQGQRLIGANIETQLRGFVEAETGAGAMILSTLLEARTPFQVGRGGAETLARKEWNATRETVSEDFTVAGSKALRLHGTGCASQSDKTVRLVLKNVLNTKTLPGYESQAPYALLSLDTADLSSKLTVALQTTACGRPPVGPGGGGGAPSVRCARDPRACPPGHGGLPPGRGGRAPGLNR